MQLTEIEISTEELSQLRPSVSYWVSIKTTIKDCRAIFREQGLRGVFKKYGWKLFAVFFIYYLVRDGVIYLLLPYLIAKGILN